MTNSFGEDGPASGLGDVGRSIPPGVGVTEIFCDENVPKVQYLASALDEAGVPFCLHERQGGNAEVGWPENALSVATDDVPRAR